MTIAANLGAGSMAGAASAAGIGLAAGSDSVRGNTGSGRKFLGLTFIENGIESHERAQVRPIFSFGGMGQTARLLGANNGDVWKAVGNSNFRLHWEALVAAPGEGTKADEQEQIKWDADAPENDPATTPNDGTNPANQDIPRSAHGSSADFNQLRIEGFSLGSGPSKEDAAAAQRPAPLAPEEFAEQRGKPENHKPASRPSLRLSSSSEQQKNASPKSAEAVPVFSEAVLTAAVPQSVPIANGWKSPQAVTSLAAETSVSARLVVNREQGTEAPEPFAGTAANRERGTENATGETHARSSTSVQTTACREGNPGLSAPPIGEGSGETGATSLGAIEFDEIDENFVQAEPRLRAPEPTSIPIIGYHAPQRTSANLDAARTPNSEIMNGNGKHDGTFLPSNASMRDAVGIGLESTHAPIGLSTSLNAREKIGNSSSTRVVHRVLPLSMSAVSNSSSISSAVAYGVARQVVPLAADHVGPFNGATVGETRGTTAGEAFALLDAESGIGHPGWIHLGGRSAEAGFEDPALGWVGVRADLNGGGLHAALLPGSEEAAQVLSAHLPGLSAHLLEGNAPVSTVTVETPAGNGLAASVGHGLQQDAQGQESQSGAAFRDSHLRDELRADSNRAGLTLEKGTNELSPAHWFDGTRGTQISVMA